MRAIREENPKITSLRVAQTLGVNLRLLNTVWERTDDDDDDEGFGSIE